MDEIVAAALRKWPNVPHCYGWLALDARGDWYLRDAAAQAAGPFPRLKGSRVDHERLRAFIERNYAADARGCWYFQNGPQRVYVELEAAPWVFRLQRADGDAGRRWLISAQGARPARCAAVWIDENGRLFLETDIGFGLVHSLDTGLAAEALEAGAWAQQGPLREMRFDDMPARFGYVLAPQP
jgi:hypothetical protein